MRWKENSRPSNIRRTPSSSPSSHFRLSPCAWRVAGTCRSRGSEPRPIPCEQWRFKAAAFAAALRKQEIYRNVIFNETLSLLTPIR